MEISKIYKKYEIRKLEEKDIEKILLICNSNPQYYEYDPPFASFESIKMDMKATPPDIRIERKYYLGFFENRRLIAILDLILEYPDSTTVYIGFFMIHNQYSKKGVGSKIISSLSTYISELGYQFLELGWIKGNKQAESFWIKNGFNVIKEKRRNENQIVMIAKKELR